MLTVQAGVTAIFLESFILDTARGRGAVSKQHRLVTRLRRVRRQQCPDIITLLLDALFMKFSIITCTWNSAEWLAESIASVDAQQDVEIERVFVDGGSEDATLDMISAVPGEVKVLNNVRGGISNAMNEGVRVASGDVIAHLHSDDFYVDGTVLQQVRDGLLGTANAKWLYGRCKSVVGGKLVDNAWETKRFSWPHLIRGNIIPHPSTFIRREIFNELGGFSNQLKYVMDYDLWLRLAIKYTPVQLDAYLSAFRFHEGSLSSTNLWPCHAECLKVRLAYAGNPIEQLEHRARHAYRSLRLVADPVRMRLGT